MFKTKLSVLAAAVGFLAAGSAQAGQVVVWGEELSGFSKTTINNFYNGLSGHSSTIATGQLNTVNLTGVNLLWATQPSDSYTNAEITKMSNFLAGGGRIAFLGEHGGFAPSQNIRINEALGLLGSTMSTVNNAVSCGFQTADRVSGDIQSHSLTTGVDRYQYACYSELTLGANGQALMYGDNLPGSVMMGYENVGPGSIFFITDQNVWDNSPNWAGYDNARMFENLLSGNTGAPPVNQTPEPGSMALLGLGLAALATKRLRKN